MPPRMIARQIQARYDPVAPPILAELSLALEAGVFVGVIGPNGSGKSTLIRALSRALKPERGVVLLEERDLFAGYSAAEAARSIAVVPQDTSISLDFSVRDVVRMGRAPHLPNRPFASETPQDERIVAEALKEAGIEDLAERSVTTLSGGERQRVLIARALAQTPQVLLLDEPTASLDLRHQSEVLTLAQSLAHGGGKAVLAVLHDVSLAAAYCDRLVLLDSGRIAAQGTPAEVLTAENLLSVYGARVWVRRNPVTGQPLVLPLPQRSPQPNRSVPLPAVHVICGGGTGTGLLLALHGRGFSLTAACLHAGDIDADAAQMLGLPFAQEDAFSLLSFARLEEAAQLARTADVAVLSDVPFGRANLANLEAALALRRAGMPVLCIQSRHTEFSSRDFTGGEAGKLWTALLAAGAAVLPSTAAALTLLEDENWPTDRSIDGSPD